MKSGTKILFSRVDRDLSVDVKKTDLQSSVCRHVLISCESEHGIRIGGEAIKFWMKNI